MKTLTCLLFLLVSALAAAGDPVIELHKPGFPWLPAPPPPGPPCSDLACPKIWKPVCGCTCDGLYCRTFGNMCELRSYNCRNTPDYNFIWNGTCDQCPQTPVPLPVKGPESHEKE
ncbi:uncharacterized protein LOC126266853 [Schistocerca gregaria]|uniref:uncharacterized protein LOC126266853 n=1 Tax=Schistocerca gregaria TaxID=7010 RepID=UPI00211E03AF|nr:uncharacterized protein LOC126266853 [Schistocerca gregaria]